MKRSVGRTVGKRGEADISGRSVSGSEPEVERLLGGKFKLLACQEDYMIVQEYM